MPLGRPLPLTADTINHVEALKGNPTQGAEDLLTSAFLPTLTVNSCHNTGDVETLKGNPTQGPEDLLTSDKLRKLGIEPETTLDSHGRQFFLPLGPHSEWNRKVRDPRFWFYRWSPEAKVGSECCSERWVASHYVSRWDMYRLNELEEAQCRLHPSEWPHWSSKGNISDAFDFKVPSLHTRFGQEGDSVWGTVHGFDRNLHSKMPLVPTPARLKRGSV